MHSTQWFTPTYCSSSEDTALFSSSIPANTTCILEMNKRDQRFLGDIYYHDTRQTPIIRTQILLNLEYNGQINREERGRGPGTPWKSNVAMGFLTNSDTDTPREAIGPVGSNCFSREVCTALCEIPWWLKKTLWGPPERISWMRAWIHAIQEIWSIFKLF